MADLTFNARHVLRIMKSSAIPYTPRNDLDRDALEELRFNRLTTQTNEYPPPETWELTVLGRETTLLQLR